MKQFLLISLTILILSACDSSQTETTPSGIKVTYMTQGVPADKLKSGNILAVKAFYRTDNNQQIIKTNPGEPAFLQYDSSQTVEQNGLVQEVFDMLNVGDSVYFEIPATNLWEVTFKRRLPDSVEEGAIVKIDLKIESQMSVMEYREYMTNLERERNAAEYVAEIERFEAYLNENGIDATITDSGLRYVIANQTQGDTPSNGDIVSVKYKGMLLDGSVFDEGTYTFPLGQGQVIAGWDQGISYLRQGERGTLYIPSELGYGSRGSGARIPPFSSLVFEVELVDIKKNENAN
jgi:FKBP-type peptidyl-prolyl cis-trans isomerase FkpA